MMTEPSRASDDAMRARLDAYFARELDRARRDPVAHTIARGTTRPLARLAAGAALAAVVVVAAIVGPRLIPTSAPVGPSLQPGLTTGPRAPSASPTVPSLSPTASPNAGASWPFRAADPAPTTAVVGPDGATYFATSPGGPGGQGAVYALDADGRPKPGWPFTPRGTGGFGRPVIAPDGTIYVVGWAYGGGSGLWALDPSGQTKAGWPYVDGGTGPIGERISVASDGGVVFVDQPSGSRTQRAIGLSPDGQVRAGWPVSLPGGLSCGTSDCAEIDGSGNWFALVSGGNGSDAHLVALRPDGTAISGWPVRVAGGEGFMLTPGVVYAWGLDTNGVVPPNGVTKIVRTRFLALGLDGQPKPGWPVTVNGPAGIPTLGADGTLYTTAGAAGQPESVLALGPDGHERSGWPHYLPSDLAAWPYGPAAGMPARATSPYVAPNGTLLLPIYRSGQIAGAQGLLALSTTGHPVSGWPAWLPPGASFANVGGYFVGGGGDLIAPVFGIDGATYLAIEGVATGEVMALDAVGRTLAGWPRPIADASGEPTRVVGLALDPVLGALIVTAQGSGGASTLVALVPMR